MLLEDYSTAIYWRIAAIFFALAALFSAGIIMWYLIFRENPNLPDETDSTEQIRFEQEPHKEKHNMLSEIIETSNQTNEIQTLDETSNKTTTAITKAGSKKKGTILNRIFSSKKNQSETNLNNSNNKKNINNNNNSYNYSKSELRKSLSTPELNRLTLDYGDDDSIDQLKELNGSQSEECLKNFADAKVTVNYLIATNVFSIQFFSILNQSCYRLTKVNVLVDIYYENKFYKRIKSNKYSISLNRYEERVFDEHFLIEFNQMSKNKISMNIHIVGILNDLVKSNLILTSNYTSQLRPLGGAHILLENLGE